MTPFILFLLSALGVTVGSRAVRKRLTVSAPTQRGRVPKRALQPRAAAELAVKNYPSQTIDSQTMHAYQYAFPHALSPFPDFYDPNQTDAVMAWIAIRDWVDYFRNRPAPGSLAVATPYQQPAPLNSLGVPLAKGVAQPTWPVLSTDPRGCQVNYLDIHGVAHGELFQRFGASRGKGSDNLGPSRYHIGHDCIANHGDVVVAPEAGKIVNIRDFYSGTKAMYIQTDTDITVNLGEISPGSHQEFNVKIGDRVEQGQPVARVGLFEVGDQLPFSMVHFEIFDGKRDRSLNWFDGRPRPKSLRNPTDYLLRAACGQPSRVTPPKPSRVTPEPPSMGLTAAQRSQLSLSPQVLDELGRVVTAIPNPNFPH